MAEWFRSIDWDAALPFIVLPLLWLAGLYLYGLVKDFRRKH